ncbi:hypothetical protein COU58_01210 [Candidatus Pacearchaeota archaeon CG10_big_fil_rev_8_21_14_0_10_32_42]|nr:MAG: hypothetical protein COU58_01210 [Candidatus Pacearchaeota archaeon CG10_big_fil_rev_8_21_14_0_10_32_42]
MKWFTKLMILMEILLTAISFIYPMSETGEIIFNSLIVGIFVFLLVILISEVSIIRYKKKQIEDAEKTKKLKIKIFIFAFIFMILSILFFINFYLYVKALIGNDLFISLNSGDKNLILNNGEEGTFDVKARVLINPFCHASCKLSMKDLGNGELLYNESLFLGFSMPFSKKIPVKINEESYGQKLYEVSLSCETLREKLCYTKTDYQKSRTEIVSIEHKLNNLQKEKAENLKNQTEFVNKEFYNLKNNLNALKFNFSYLDLSKFENDSVSFNEFINSFNANVSKLIIFYESQKYSDLEKEINLSIEELKNVSLKFNHFNSSLQSEINLYNSMVENLTLMHEELAFIEEYNFSNYSIEIAELFVGNFNLAIINLSEKDFVFKKIYLLNIIKSEKENLLNIIEEENNSAIVREMKITKNLSEINFSKINIGAEIPAHTFVLKEPSPICCLNNECYPCMEDANLNYPIILIHGHNFNKKLSVETSLDALNGLSQSFENDGYINAGSLYQNTYDELSKGYLGKVNRSVIFKPTYYLDPSKEGDPFAMNSEWGDMDTYASRLNEIILNVKYLTGKDKVILVAHSMGGLVVRRNIQLYGGEEIEKLILVTVPNHGVDGFVLNYCSFFGVDVECAQMDKSSSFMNLINEAPELKVPTYNLVGLGCFWENSVGDGIVKNESAYFEGVENLFFNGKCNGFDFFHGNVFDTSLYPEIYETIKKLIENKQKI